MELRTERLVLRPVSADDLATMLAIRNAPDVIGTTNTREPLPRERMQAQLERRLASWRDRGFGSWLVLLEAEPVAFVEVTPIGEGSGVDPDEIELGVVVHPDHWGQGIAAEAGLAVAGDCFRRVGLERVYAGVEPTKTIRSGCSPRCPVSGRSRASCTSSPRPRSSVRVAACPRCSHRARVPS
jgi:[ribosomal protein S5]-alanine N-acetyltransferase